MVDFPDIVALGAAGTRFLKTGLKTLGTGTCLAVVQIVRGNAPCKVDGNY